MFTEEELCNRDEDSEMEEDSWDIVRLPGSSGPTDRSENTKWSSQTTNILFGTNVLNTFGISDVVGRAIAYKHPDVFSGLVFEKSLV